MRLRVAAISVALCTSIACAAHQPPAVEWPRPYLDAIQDARDPEPGEVVDNLQSRCTAAAFASGDLAMRLRQLLGLTPNFPVIAFVEMWVLPSQLFRPAADNSITGNSAGLTVPPTTEPRYRRWFNELRATQYFQSTNPPHDAYPWTQLGYTYDWGSANHVGLSEFVIRQQSSVYINRITPYLQYCAVPSRPDRR